jgi:hypothetical protein
MNSTPVRLAVEGADSDGFAVVAGRSHDGRMLRILISNYEIPTQFLGRRAGDDVLHVPPLFDVRLLARRTIAYRNNSGFDLTVEHLPRDRTYVIERCRISAGDDFKRVTTTLHPGERVHLSEDLPPPGVELVTLRALTPHARPPVSGAPYCGAQ